MKDLKEMADAARIAAASAGPTDPKIAKFWAELNGRFDERRSDEAPPVAPTISPRKMREE